MSASSSADPKTESVKLSLWTIENALVELIQAREEVETVYNELQPSEDKGERMRELAEIDKAIAEYVRAEVGKVDNIRGFLKHAEMMAEAARAEAEAQASRARAWELRSERVKGMVQDVMAQMDWKPDKPRRLEGRTGAFLLKRNGGIQPLIVTDEAAVPEECCKYEGWIGGELWGKIKAFLPLIAQRYGTPFASDYRLGRVVDNERTRDRLKSACMMCGGTGGDEQLSCPVCGTLGTEPVPGARLGDRGEHLEIK